ncbi:MAG: hypothetical protein M3044_12840 [Thermoproteota archaeon]|nr:hypothetical protein [Thermoproteota archaeon]
MSEGYEYNIIEGKRQESTYKRPLDANELLVQSKETARDIETEKLRQEQLKVYESSSNVLIHTD